MQRPGGERVTEGGTGGWSEVGGLLGGDAELVDPMGPWERERILF